MPILSESDVMIADSALAFVEKTGGVTRARKLRSPWPSFDRNAWREIAELGWLGMLVPETAGGLGLDARSTVALLDKVGSRLLPEPIVPAIAAATLLARCGEPARELLERLLSGANICLPALPIGENGELEFWDGHAADSFLVEIERDGESGAYIVPRNIQGLTVNFDETVDGGSRGEIRLEGVDRSQLVCIASGEIARSAFAEALSFMRLGYAALLTGLMDGALALTTDYLKTRKQFGVAIGSFQSLQHRAATALVSVSSSHALVYEAASAFGTLRQHQAAAAAKARTSELAVNVVKDCIQSHGAIGFTDEHDIGLFFRRALALSVAGGDAKTCRRVVIAGGASNR